MLGRLMWWRRPPEEQPRLTGWALELPEGSREFQLELARDRTDALMAFMSDQESKIVALFGVATLLVSASGVFGDLELRRSWTSVPDVAVLITSATAWLISLAAYRPRQHNLGPDPADFRDRFSSRFNADELRGFALESWVLAYEANAELMDRKGYWLRRLMIAVVIQAAAIVAAELIGR